MSRILPGHIYILILFWISLLYGCAAFSFAYPVKGVAIMPPETNQEDAFKAAQGIIAARGYNISQANPQTGLISSEKKDMGIINFQIARDTDKKVYILMSVDASTGNPWHTPPPQLVKSDIVNTFKIISKRLGVDQNSVTVKFKDEQKPLSSY